MRCPQCSGVDVGQIRFGFSDKGLRFHYCRGCENRWWRSSDSNVPLKDVLRAASSLARAS